MLVRYLKPYLLQSLVALGMLALYKLFPNSGLEYSWTALPAIIGAIGTGYGMYSQNKASQQQKDLIKSQKDIFNRTAPTADQYFQQSQQAIAPTLSYYTGLMSNPREATAPEQNRLGGMYAGQVSNARSQYGRGGFGPAAAENLRGQYRATNESIIQQARPQAAGALGQLGTGLGSLGYQGYGLGAGILGNVFSQGLAARQQEINLGGQLGQGLYNAYNNYLLQRSLQQPGTTTTTTTTGTGAGAGVGH